MPPFFTLFTFFAPSTWATRSLDISNFLPPPSVSIYSSATVFYVTCKCFIYLFCVAFTFKYRVYIVKMCKCMNIVKMRSQLWVNVTSKCYWCLVMIIEILLIFVGIRIVYFILCYIRSQNHDKLFPWLRVQPSVDNLEKYFAGFSFRNKIIAPDVPWITTVVLLIY